jgi:hypothetical protein
MNMKVYRIFKYRQGGAALLMFMLILIVGSSYLIMTGMNARAQIVANYGQTMDALRQGKEALISYALIHSDIDLTSPAGPDFPGEFGILPCPDVNPLLGEEGNQDPVCGGKYINSLGKFPWQSLGLPPLKDSYGQCLWYAVSGYYKNNIKPDMVNEDTHGTFRLVDSDGSTVLAGSTATDRPIAIIFAPGRSINNQSRENATGSRICGGNNTASNYLDAELPGNPALGIRNYSLSGTANTIDQFILTDNPESEVFNDVITYVTPADIFDAIGKRNDYAGKLYDQSDVNNMTKQVADCMVTYGSNHGGGNYSLPWPAPDTLTDYRNNNSYDDVNGSSNILSGRIPIIIDDSSSQTGSTITNLITYCFSGNAELSTLWKNWKDHLYYAVADAYKPSPGTTPDCASGLQCITINNDYPGNGGRDYAAVVIFSGTRIPSTQGRNAPPIDIDQKGTVSNYLEGANNITDYPDTAGNDTKRYDNADASSTFNDVLYCINNHGGIGNDFEVALCPDN